MHIGIDYGSKLAGTTVLCWANKKQLHLAQSQKKQDADQWLQEQVEALKPSRIYLDAPLSLPSAYFGKGTDYFYRACDRELKAMSPMFIGGLTARAMRLAGQWREAGFEVIEIYPAQLTRLLPDFRPHYQKKSAITEDCLAALKEELALPYAIPPNNWHQIDALLAWLSGHRHQQQQAKIYGDPEEGQIIV